MGAFVEFENVSKIYKTGDVEVHALTDASFEIQKGEFCVIVGESGAGKTTLLNILGGMDTLSKGTVRMDGRDISHFNRTQLENYRRYDIGFVFQFYNLIPNLTALENVEIAAQLCTDAIPAEDVLRRGSVSMTACRTFPHSSRAVNSSVFPLPAHLPKNRSSFCATSPPAHSITRPANLF